jgi:hypothetical protein
MFKAMKTKYLKKLTEKLNGNDGVSLIAIMTMLVIMSVMGGVFSSVMGRWKLSAPANINSSKALYLAETAVMFALQDAQNRFFSKDATGTPLFPSATTGTRDNPYVVSSSSTESAEYWIERPYSGASPYSTNSTVDLGRGNNDDIITGTNDDEDVEDDDSDDDDTTGTNDANSDGYSDVYTIIATGKVLIDGTTTTIAKRQIKIKATITDNFGDPVASGIHAAGSIRGSGSGAFQIWQDSLDVGDDDPSVTFSNGTYADSDAVPDSGSRADVVYQPPADDPPDLDEEYFKAVAADQGHYNPTIPNNTTYPVGSNSFYSYFVDADNNMPNITYIDGNLGDQATGALEGVTLYGIYYVTGNIALQGNIQVEGILIGNNDIKFSASGAASDPHLEGGIIQLGSGGKVWGAGNPTTVLINNAFFDALNNTMPTITIQSLQEAVSAN